MALVILGSGERGELFLSYAPVSLRPDITHLSIKILVKISQDCWLRGELSSFTKGHKIHVYGKLHLGSGGAVAHYLLLQPVHPLQLDHDCCANVSEVFHLHTSPELGFQYAKGMLSVHACSI